MELKFVEINAKRIEIISLAFASFRTIERIGFLWRQSLESLLSTFIPPRIVLSRLLYRLSTHRTRQSISVLEFTVFHAAIQERRSLLWSPFWIQRSGSIECPSRNWKKSLWKHSERCNSSCDCRVLRPFDSNRVGGQMSIRGMWDIREPANSQIVVHFAAEFGQSFQKEKLRKWINYDWPLGWVNHLSTICWIMATSWAALNGIFQAISLKSISDANYSIDCVRSLNRWPFGKWFFFNSTASGKSSIERWWALWLACSRRGRIKMAIYLEPGFAVNPFQRFKC